MNSLTRYGVGDIRLSEQEKPVIEKGEVLLSVEACGVCGTDMHVYKGMPNGWKLPGIIGHEFAGEVCEVHESVMDYQVGDKVTVQPLMNCGKCSFCLEGRTNLCRNMHLIGGEYNGGMAEYVKVKAKQLVKFPEDVQLKYGALVEPTATVVHALNRRKHKKVKTAVIFGAGSLGLITLQLLRQDCEKVVVVDIAPQRLKKALLLGADEAINSRDTDINKYLEIEFGHEEIDLIIDAAGVNAVRKAAFDNIRPGGEIICIALGEKEYTVDFMQIVTQEISVYGTQCHTLTDYKQAIDHIRNNAIDFDNIVSFIPLEEGEKAFKSLANNVDEHIKVVFTMDGSTERSAN